MPDVNQKTQRRKIFLNLAIFNAATCQTDVGAEWVDLVPNVGYQPDFSGCRPNPLCANLRLRNRELAKITNLRVIFLLVAG